MSNTKPHPPSILLRFFRWFCHPDLAIYIEGDLIELFEERVDSRGGRKAKWLFAFDVLKLFRPDIIRPVSGFQRLNNYGMFQNHVKSAWRNLLKRKKFSTLNILGLSIGMASCILILQYVRFEKSYDNFHPDIENIYRLTLEINGSENSDKNTLATNHPAAGLAMKADFPQVVEFTRLVPLSTFGTTVFLHKTDDQQIKSFYEDKVYVTEPSFFNIFNYSLVAGNKETALREPNSIIITQRLAKKYFGEINSLGKVMILNNKHNLKVTGVLNKIPENSHLKVEALISFSTYGNGAYMDSNWKWPAFFTYLKLSPGTNVINLEDQLDGFVDKYLGDVMEEFGLEEHMHLQPVADIHLHSQLKSEAEENGSYETVAFFTLISIMILFIAWINYVNLSTSRSIERAGEVGIRKVVGASKMNLILQFFIESAIINLLAVSLALVLVELSAPAINSLIGKQFFSGILVLEFWSQPSNWLILVSILIGGSLLAGFYPALVLSSFKPIKIFNVHRSNNKLSFRSVLVVFQFCITFVLIVGTLMVFSQLRFMQNKKLGFNMDQIVVVKSPKAIDSTYQVKEEFLKGQLLKQTNIHHVASSGDIPGHQLNDLNTIKKKGAPTEDGFIVNRIYLDERFIPAYEIELIAGRNFIKDMNTDKESVIVNEIVVQMLGYESPEEVIGTTVTMKYMKDWIDVRVIGVTKSINSRSLAYRQSPLVFPFLRVPGPESNMQSVSNYYSLKISATDLQQTLAKTENAFKEVFPNEPFEYFFLDDHFNEQYKADQQFGKIFGVFTSLAIIVACLGLFGLVSYVSSTRTKEIGIRKVMGASTMQILSLLSKQFVKLLIIAAILAVPISWWGGDTWLSNYAYRIEIDGWLFAGAALIVFSIALITVLWQSISTANANPVDSLRDE